MSEFLSGTPNLQQLEKKLGCSWLSIRKANTDTQRRREKLDACFQNQDSPDTSLVVFGSVARQEVTDSSDLDWILLIDGQSAPEHKEQERKIENLLSKGGFIEPGRSGVFGKMVGSHDLVHNIGGEDDTNSNTTRRVLLLLESSPVGKPEVYERVRRQILRRYLEDDRGLTHASSNIRIPRFLLNDFTRYWRTITVDFVYKQRADNEKKWALRNAKLRMSRKLIFAKGLSLVFFCHLDPQAAECRAALRDKKVDPLTVYLEPLSASTPLELVAKLCLDLKICAGTAKKIFDNYDRFLFLMDDGVKRGELEKAPPHMDFRSSTAWKEVSDLSKPFHEGLVALFLEENKDLSHITKTYGLF